MELTIGCGRLSVFNSMQTEGCCTFCGSEMNRLYCYTLNKSKHLLCELCVVVYKFSDQMLTKGILCFSEMDQIMIINKTREFFLTNKRIPNIIEIDPSAHLINCSAMKMIEMFSNIKPDKIDHFNNVKVFITDRIDFKNFPYNQFTFKPVRYNDLQFFKKNIIPKKELTNVQKSFISS
jgi:hypothetical protein